MRYIGLALFVVLASSNAWELATEPSHRWKAAFDLSGLVIGIAGVILMLLKPAWFEPRSSRNLDTLRLRDDTDGPAQDREAKASAEQAR
jgi:hypothetical protein